MTNGDLVRVIKAPLDKYNNNSHKRYYETHMDLFLNNKIVKIIGPVENKCVDKIQWYFIESTSRFMLPVNAIEKVFEL